MTPTIEILKERQAELAAMIAAFEAQAETTYLFPETEIVLRPGEHYAGLIVGKDGEPSYHLVLLPGAVDDQTFAEANTWAVNAGGALPTRREQALLYANLKEQLEAAWYWSSEAHSDSRYAWAQHFNDGTQLDGSTDDQFRARAVRRLVIE